MLTVDAMSGLVIRISLARFVSASIKAFVKVM